MDHVTQVDEPLTEMDKQGLCSNLATEGRPAGVIIIAVTGCQDVLSTVQQNCPDLFADGTAWLGTDGCYEAREGPPGFAFIAPLVKTRGISTDSTSPAISAQLARKLMEPVLGSPGTAAQTV